MSDPVKQVTNAARGVSWNIVALALVLPLLFSIIIWQLWGLTPDAYCSIVKSEGVPPGDHCFKLLQEVLRIKGWTIWLLIATLALFVIIVLIAAVKTFVSLNGPGGWGATFRPEGSSNDAQ